MVPVATLLLTTRDPSYCCLGSISLLHGCCQRPWQVAAKMPKEQPRTGVSTIMHVGHGKVSNNSYCLDNNETIAVSMVMNVTACGVHVIQGYYSWV